MVFKPRRGTIPTPAAPAPSQVRLTCDQTVTYTQAYGRSLPGPRRPHPPPPARRTVQTGRTDAQRARAAAPHDPLRGHEAPAGAPEAGLVPNPRRGAREPPLP